MISLFSFLTTWKLLPTDPYYESFEDQALRMRNLQLHDSISQQCSHPHTKNSHKTQAVRLRSMQKILREPGISAGAYELSHW